MGCWGVGLVSVGVYFPHICRNFLVECGGSGLVQSVRMWHSWCRWARSRHMFSWMSCSCGFVAGGSSWIK